jgi:hypothetical protein
MFSAAKVAAVIYGGLGLIVGTILSLASAAGTMVGIFQDVGPRALFGLVFGVGAIVFLPILYMAIGFVVGFVGSGLYNLAARFTGGLEVDLR